MQVKIHALELAETITGALGRYLTRKSAGYGLRAECARVDRIRVAQDALWTAGGLTWDDDRKGFVLRG